MFGPATVVVYGSASRTRERYQPAQTRASRIAFTSLQLLASNVGQRGFCADCGSPLVMLTRADRSEEALGALQRAVRLDPFHPPNYMRRIAFAYAGVGDYEQCVEVAKRAIALDPNFVGSHVDLVLCYAALGAEEEARTDAAEIIRTNPRFTLKAYAAYAPYANELDLKLDVERLRNAGVPE